jgi:integrase
MTRSIMSIPYIDAHLRHLRAAGRAKRTIDERRIVLRSADRDLPHGLIRASTAELEQWLAQYLGWTLCTYAMHLRGFFAWATSGCDPWLDWDPTADLPHPKRPRRIPNPVTDAQLVRAYVGSNRQWRLVILLAALAGLRADEIARLRREDVTAAVLVVHGKGDVDATVPTHALIWAAVKDLPAGPLIHTPSGQSATGRWLSIKAREHFNRLDLPDVTLHRFRSWFGTGAQAVQGDLRVTQDLMRHANPTTTAPYALVADERLRQTVDALPVPGGLLDGAATSPAPGAGAESASI